MRTLITLVALSAVLLSLGVHAFAGEAGLEGNTFNQEPTHVYVTAEGGQRTLVIWTAPAPISLEEIRPEVRD